MKIPLLKMSFLLPALALASMSIGSCKKHKDTDCAVTLANVAGTYKLTALTYTPDTGGAEQDVLHLAVEPCELDDLTILKDDGTYHNEDAGTVCTPNGNSDGYWSLNGNTISSDGMIGGTVKSFDCSHLVLEATGPDRGGHLTFTMTKQ